MDTDTVTEPKTVFVPYREPVRKSQYPNHNGQMDSSIYWNVWLETYKPEQPDKNI